MADRMVSNEELKSICCEILINFKAFCKKNKLKFFMAYGTALGAVRHKGFIPWDDDIDVVMPRSDYDKLIQIYNNDNEQYKLLCHELDDSYFYPFAKLCDKNTVLIEEHFANDKNMGVYIDIFPLDGGGNNREAAEKHLRKCIRTQQKLNHAMAKHFFKGHNNILKEILRFLRAKIIKSIGAPHYYNKLDLLLKKYSYGESKYIANASWCIYAIKDLFEKEMFEQSTDIEFEKHLFPIPENYDAYLNSLYGDYMKLPPKEEQTSHHGMTVYYKEGFKCNGS